ncbi:type II toxin-antitoxin system PemK/MazF family toxin [Cellulomonas sp. PhB143]|uniref:type II toxin-antitoxin system PemK/MazF family toxin n=1 Tax=Cellulomonas sp. PhB143 TaxID=2485186 RepID=UPI000F47CAC2|nr:type II toxin-antitoxin system PemK/MazF family toxin [Cellulomonas sp. PhB143]ROS73605.1 mRNA interferase MazF [Cellulomonas sp. PhB143]
MADGVIHRGDVVWASMDPVVGHERSGHRPYLVLSEERFHRSRGLLLVVPMTSRRRDLPTWVELGPESFAIAEQPKTMSAKRVTRVDRAGHDVREVARLVAYLVGA